MGRTGHFDGFLLLTHHLEKALEAIDLVAEIALAGGATLLEHRIQFVVDLRDAKVDGVGAEMERNRSYAPCVVGRGALAPLRKLPRGFFRFSWYKISWISTLLYEKRLNLCHSFRKVGPRCTSLPTGGLVQQPLNPIWA